MCPQVLEKTYSGYLRGRKKKVNTTKAHRDNMIGTIIKGRTNKNINETEEGWQNTVTGGCNVSQFCECFYMELVNM